MFFAMGGGTTHENHILLDRRVFPEHGCREALQRAGSRSSSAGTSLAQSRYSRGDSIWVGPERDCFPRHSLRCSACGELCWKPPQPVISWTGKRKSTEYGSACPQLRVHWLPFLGWYEDCLFVNVWTAQASAQAKLLVIVYFHGGSNTAGYSHGKPRGPSLAPLGVFVVSANYRLGPVGFFAHPALTAESRHRSSGNCRGSASFPPMRF